jgi:hypothetical protein
MKRQVPGLAETARDSRPEIPDGIYLVRVDGAQFRWHATKPFYVLRLSIVEPRIPSPGSRLWVVSTARKRQCGSWAGSCEIFSMTRNFWPTNRSMRRLCPDSAESSRSATP